MKVRNAAPASLQHSSKGRQWGEGEGSSLLLPNWSAYSRTLSQIVAMKVRNADPAAQQQREGVERGGGMQLTVAQPVSLQRFPQPDCYDESVHCCSCSTAAKVVGRGEGFRLLLPNWPAYSWILSQIVAMKVRNAVPAAQQHR